MFVLIDCSEFLITVTATLVYSEQFSRDVFTEDSEAFTKIIFTAYPSSLLITTVSHNVCVNLVCPMGTFFTSFFIVSESHNTKTLRPVSYDNKPPRFTSRKDLCTLYMMRHGNLEIYVFI